MDTYISYHVCYVAKKNTIGDSPTFVGKVTKDSTNPDKNTSCLYREKYWIVKTELIKPSKKEIERIKE